MAITYKRFRIRHPDTEGRIIAYVRARWNGRAWVMDFNADMVAPAYCLVPGFRGERVPGNVVGQTFRPYSTSGFWPRITPRA